MTISVLMFCPQFRPIVGGAERQAEKLAKALVAKGVKIKIVTPRYSNDAPEHEASAGLEIVRFPIFDLCRSFPWLRCVGIINLQLIRFQVMRAVSAQMGEAGIVHTHIASPLSAFAMQVACKKKIPVICKVASASRKNDFTATAAVGLGGVRICSLMTRHMDKWIAVTKPVKTVLLQWQVPSERIVSIPNGVQLRGESAENRPDLAKKFLYLGRLSSRIARDVPTVIRAFDRLAAQISGIELALVGDGDQYQETADLVAGCKHRDQFHLPGLQEPEPWLRWADCFVLPSRREGLSNALLEAMAYGLPCIANDIPPNREVLQDGKAGVLVPVEDEEQLLKEMQAMASNHEKVSFFGEAAFQRVKNMYSIESVAEQYIRLYEELCNRNIPPLKTYMTKSSSID